MWMVFSFVVGALSIKCQISALVDKRYGSPNFDRDRYPKLLDDIIPAVITQREHLPQTSKTSPSRDLVIAR